MPKTVICHEQFYDLLNCGGSRSLYWYFEFSVIKTFECLGIYFLWYYF